MVNNSVNITSLKAKEILQKIMTFDKLNFPILDTKFLDKIDCSYLDNEDYLINTLLNFYSKNDYKHLRRIINNWKNYNCVIKRSELLDTIINILKSKLSNRDKANSIIPMLLANIDGTIKDMYLSLDLAENPNFAQHEKMLRKMTENILETHFFIGKNFLKVIYFLFYSERGFSINKNIEMLNFSKLDCKNGYKHILDRNKILHGETQNYGSILELTRLVLFYDISLLTIQYLLDKNNEDI